MLPFFWLRHFCKRWNTEGFTAVSFPIRGREKERAHTCTRHFIVHRQLSLSGSNSQQPGQGGRAWGGTCMHMACGFWRSHERNGGTVQLTWTQARCSLQPGRSKCGPWSSRSCITWAVVGNENLWPYSTSAESESACELPRFTGQPHTCENMRSIVFGICYCFLHPALPLKWPHHWYSSLKISEGGETPPLPHP